MTDPGKPGDFSTVIGADATFKGDLSFESAVRVDGKLEGKISTKGRLHVSKDGRLKADVEAGSVSVEGTVEGNMSANDRIEIRESAKITGDLVAARLAVAEGAVMNGNLKIGTGAKGPAAAAPPPRPAGAPGKPQPAAKG